MIWKWLLNILYVLIKFHRSSQPDDVYPARLPCAILAGIDLVIYVCNDSLLLSLPVHQPTKESTNCLARPSDLQKNCYIMMSYANKLWDYKICFTMVFLAVFSICWRNWVLYMECWEIAGQSIFKWKFLAIFWESITKSILTFKKISWESPFPPFHCQMEMCMLQKLLLLGKNAEMLKCTHKLRINKELRKKACTCLQNYMEKVLIISYFFCATYILF